MGIPIIFPFCLSQRDQERGVYGDGFQYSEVWVKPKRSAASDYIFCCSLQANKDMCINISILHLCSIFYYSNKEKKKKRRCEI